MSLTGQLRFHFMKDLGAPALMGLQNITRKKRIRKPDPLFSPPLKCTARLKEIMTRHYYLARFVPGAKPVAWVTSGAPVELLRSFGFYTIYPENHGALVGAKKQGADMCAIAEGNGYSPDLCSYARIDLAHTLSGKTPVGRLPKPDILFAANNICQTIVYWFKAIAHHYDIPLVLLDTPFNYSAINDGDIKYMVAQLQEMIPVLEQAAKKKFSYAGFQKIVSRARDTSLAWSEVLATMKNRPAPMTIFETFFHLAPIVSLRGLTVTYDYYQVLLEELQQRIRQGIGAVTNERKRLMWDNIAIWYKVRDHSVQFAEQGMNFVTATYTNAWAETTIYMDVNNPFESMAKTYSLVILNNNLDYRWRLMERLIKEYQVDGLVIHSARSCKPYSVGQYDIKRKLRERLGIPAVVIDGDITDARAYSEEQTRTRLEAFFETMGD